MNIDHLLKDTINVASVSGKGIEAGRAVYGSAVAIEARVENIHEETIGEGGRTVNLRHMILTKTQIKKDDKIWMPGDSTSDDTLARHPQRIVSATGIADAQTLYEVKL